MLSDLHRFSLPVGSPITQNEAQSEETQMRLEHWMKTNIYTGHPE